MSYCDETVKELKQIHGNQTCWICGKPKWEKGSLDCSYPHARIEDKTENGQAMWVLPSE